MREEAIIAVAEYGWSKAAMTKMRKIDSFMKECLRLNSLGSCEYSIAMLLDALLIRTATLVLLARKAVKDWTMSDGTIIPAGTLLGVATGAMNTSEVNSMIQNSC